MNESDTPYASQRVIASLNRDQIDFLDKIGKDAQFSSGVKLSRTQILAAMVNVMRTMELSGEGVSSIEEFEDQILNTVLSYKFKHNGSSGQRTPKSGKGGGAK